MSKKAKGGKKEAENKKNRLISTSSEEEVGETVKNKMQGLIKEIQELTKSVNFMSEKMDEVLKENKELRIAVKEMDKENKEIKLKVSQLETRLNDIEQEKMGNRIVVKGIPRQNKEITPMQILKKVTAAINVRLEDKDVKECYIKNNTRESEKQIMMVKLTNEEIKNVIIEKKKQARNIRASQCNLHGGEGTIYIEEQLTDHNSRIFFAARQLKKEAGYKYVWVSAGKILVRKKEGDRIKQITSDKDVEEILRNNQELQIRKGKKKVRKKKNFKKIK